MSAVRPISVTIAALGGQGGGVITDWLVLAARSAGHIAQATSVPGKRASICASALPPGSLGPPRKVCL